MNGTELHKHRRQKLTHIHCNPQPATRQREGSVMAILRLNLERWNLERPNLERLNLKWTEPRMD
jgi:hypothetical protein